MATAVIIISILPNRVTKNSPPILNRHWSDEGIGFTWGCSVADIDDTAMCFRLLRQHGYHVSTGMQAVHYRFNYTIIRQLAFLILIILIWIIDVRTYTKRP